MAKNLEEVQKKLDQIKADIISSNICPDLAKTASRLVMGHGNPGAEIIFIGEAPGKQEDIHGVPFVGAAGKLLDEMLASINLDRHDVYITNIVKYRPPNNRDPSPEEKRQFWPYLLREIQVIGPKVVVTLGRHSMGYFLPDESIGEVHGQQFEINLSIPPAGEKSFMPIHLLPLYHPAAALYNGGLRQTLFNDFKIIKKLIN